jgi:hypothetical protein
MSVVFPKPCEDFGVDGSHVKLTNPLPPGKVCVLSGFAQTADTIKVEVIAEPNKVVAAIVKDGSVTNLTPMKAVDGFSHHFKAETGAVYFLKVTTNGNPKNRVILREYTLTHGLTIYAGGFIIAVEDSPKGDCDFNDVVAHLTWTNGEG